MIRKTSGWIAPVIAALILVAGCAQGASEKPYGTLGSAVRPTSAGNYVYFNGKFETAASGQYVFNFDYDELNTVTDDERIGQYLVAKGLMPPECKSGIGVLRGGRGENGKAWLIFKCR